jgi:uncharacterized protein (DUF2147 family)
LANQSIDLRKTLEIRNIKSPSYPITKLVSPSYGGGYGGSSKLTPQQQEAQAKAQAEAQAKAQAEAKARAEEQARQQAQIEQARQRFQANLRNVKGISGQQSAREQFNKQVSQIQAGKNLNQISTTTPKPTTTSTNKYIVKAGGSVTELNQETGGSRYIGSAYIPELGMTAREYAKQVSKEAVKSGVIKQEDIFKNRIRVEEVGASTKNDISPTKNNIYFDVPKHTKGIYTSDLQGYISQSKTGYGATGIITPPNYEEQIRLNKLNENILTIDSNELKKNEKAIIEVKSLEKDLNNIENDIKKYEKKIDDLGEWTGTETELKTYNSKIDEYNKKLNKFNSVSNIANRNINVGLGLFSKSVPLSTFAVKNPIERSSMIISKTLGATAEQGYKLGSYSIYPFIPEIVKSKPKVTGESIGDIIRDPSLIKGYFQSSPEVIYTNGIAKTPSKQELTNINFGFGTYDEKFQGISSRSKSFGKSVELGVETGKYFIPYIGTSLFAGEVAYNLKEAGYNPVTYIKEKPLEAGAIALGVGLIGYKALRNRFGAEKFIRNPEARIVQLRNKNIYEDSLLNKNYNPEIKGSLFDDIFRVDVNRKLKSKTKINTYTPSKEFTGKVTEYYKGKKYSGSVNLMDNVYIENIPIKSNLRKITTINLETGKGKVELFKNKELFKSVNIESGTNILKLSKPETSKININTQYNPNVAIADIKINKKNARLLQGDIKTLSPSLESSRITGKFETSVRQGKDIGTGEFLIKKEDYGFYDIIKSGERKGLVQFKTDRGNIVIKGRRSQNIEFGINKDMDIGVFSRVDGRIIRKRLISPKTTRKIEEGSSQELVFGFVNPKSNKLKVLRRVQEEEVNRIKKVVGDLKEYNRVQEAIQIKELQALKLKRAEKPKTILDLPGTVYVSPSSTLLQGKSNFDINIPTSTTIVSTEATTLLPINRFSLINSNQNSFSEVSLLENTRTTTTQLPILQISPKITTQQIQILNPEITTKTKSNVKENLISKNLVKSLSILKETQVSKENLSLTSLLKTSQVLKNSQTFKQNQITRQKPKEQKKPIPKYPKGILSAIDKVKKMSKESPELFEVFVKKLGKDVSIGIAKTKKEAESILSSELKTTLRASGFVKKGGKRLTAKELDLFGTGFTQSKSDIFRIVQPKTQRLGTKSETREIQYFKKSPTKKQKTASYFFGGI